MLKINNRTPISNNFLPVIPVLQFPLMQIPVLPPAGESHRIISLCDSPEGAGLSLRYCFSRNDITASII